MVAIYRYERAVVKEIGHPGGVESRFLRSTIHEAGSVPKLDPDRRGIVARLPLELTDRHRSFNGPRPLLPAQVGITMQ
jgi:hypothetical protein